MVRHFGHTKRQSAGGIKGEVYINTLMLRLGEKLYFSYGSEKNIKVTTVDDLELFKALLKMEREDWIK